MCIYVYNFYNMKIGIQSGNVLKNELKEHTKTLWIRFDAHEGLFQSLENKSM